jgi:putative addiction module killer protein
MGTIETTEGFDAWIFGLDKQNKQRLAKRLLQIEGGNLGDHKQIAENLFEARCFFGGGIRLYYTVAPDGTVLMLSGGDKDTQGRDVSAAKKALGGAGGQNG